MLATNKGKLCISVHQLNGTEWIHIVWPMKFCSKVGANLFSLACKHFQGNKIKSDHKNNIMVHFSEGNIILDHCLKTHDGWSQTKVCYCIQLVYAILNCWKFSSFLRNGLWAASANTAMFLENNLVTPNRDLNPFQHVCQVKEKHPDFSAKIW